MVVLYGVLYPVVHVTADLEKLVHVEKINLGV